MMKSSIFFSTCAFSFSVKRTLIALEIRAHRALLLWVITVWLIIINRSVISYHIHLEYQFNQVSDTIGISMVLRIFCMSTFLILRTNLAWNRSWISFTNEIFLRLLGKRCSWRMRQYRYPSVARIHSDQDPTTWDLFVRHELHAVIGGSMKSSNFWQGTNGRRM